MTKVSITIPSRNEEGYIEKCLQSIIDSDFSKDNLEVFVCDGLSTDNTQKQVREFEKEYKFIHLLINKKQTTPHALNLGLKAAKADYKIILGAHAEINRNFICENIKVFEQINNEKIACVGGVIENIFENKESEIIGYAMSTPFGVGDAYFRTGKKSGYVDTVAFGAYKADVFGKIGYFDESLSRNQDDELNYRLLKNNYKIYLSNKIKSKYYVRASFSKLFKQYYQYGYWKVVVNKKHKSITTIRQLIPGIFVLFLIIGFISLWINFIFAGLYVLGLFLYFSVAFYESSKTNFNFTNKLKLVLSFLILHISYGIGYIISIKDICVFRNFDNNNKTQLTR